MRKLERQPHASLSAWALILHTLRKTAFRAAAKPGTSPSGSASFSLLPFGSPQTTTPASGTSAKWLVASKPFGRLCLAPKYGKLPGHLTWVWARAAEPRQEAPAMALPQIRATSQGCTSGTPTTLGLSFCRGVCSCSHFPPPPFPGSSPGPSRARLQHPWGSGGAAGHRSPMAGAMLPSAGTGAALQRGTSRTRRGAGGEGTPGGPAHQARQVFDPSFPPAKPANKTHGHFSQRLPRTALTFSSGGCRGARGHWFFGLLVDAFLACNLQWNCLITSSSHGRSLDIPKPPQKSSGESHLGGTAQPCRDALSLGARAAPGSPRRSCCR